MQPIRKILREVSLKNHHCLWTKGFSVSASSRGDGPKIAVVGGGAAGFYASQQIAKARPDAEIDIYEKLPVPFGLVRFGVAPDHQDVKKCISTFNKIADMNNVNFIGNCSLGTDFSLGDLKNCYDSILLTYGTDEDRRLGIPGEHLDNVLGARDLVSVYNGLPGYEDFDINLDTDTVTVIGVGNVSIDVARLILTPVDKLRQFDVTESWLEKLSKSRVKRVVMVGRRGPLHVSFTIKELREMIRLEGTRTIFHKDQFLPIQDLVSKLQRPKKRLIELLVNTALKEPDAATVQRWASATREWELKLLRSPVELLPDSDGKSVGKIRLSVNIPEGDSVIQSDEVEEIETGLVLRSIGFKSIQADPTVPFDMNKGIVPNTDGRVSDGVYTAGWLGTGPRGVIIDTMNNAFKVAGNLIKDIVDVREGKGGLSAMPHLPNKTTWQHWKNIEQYEESLGKPKGKLREKLWTVESMLEAAKI